MEKRLLNDDVPFIPKADYCRTFFGIDPFVKQKKINEGSKQKIPEKYISLRQKKNESAIAAADPSDDRLYEFAIRRYATTSGTELSAPETSNFDAASSRPTRPARKEIRIR